MNNDKTTTTEIPQTSANQSDQPVVVNGVNGQETYAIFLGNGSYHIQRKQEANATDTPMNIYEKIICALCERVLSLETR